MRAVADDARIRRFMEAFGRETSGPGRVYLTGGATAVLEGWRTTTVDIDLKLDPEPSGAFDAIRRLKDELDVNVELASPDDFIPEVPGFRDRSRFIGRYGEVDFYHYDPFAQALAKIERGHARDLTDVDQLLVRGWIDKDRLRDLFEAIRPGLLRYPAIDERSFADKVTRFLEKAT
jgi:hypothetical protein